MYGNNYSVTPFFNKFFCVAAFLDASQTFDKVWHQGPLYKLQKILQHTLYLILKFYLQERYFMAKQKQEITKLYSWKSGFQQDSVLGSILYLLFTNRPPHK